MLLENIRGSGLRCAGRVVRGGYLEVTKLVHHALPHRVQVPALVAVVRVEQDEPGDFGGYKLCVIGIRDAGAVAHHLAVFFFFVLFFCGVLHLAINGSYDCAER